MLKAVNIKKSYGQLEVLKDINLDVKKGEIISIVGASGAGKTTLLQILGTLEPTQSGNLFINSIDVTQLTKNQLADFRNQEIGFVFQFHQLLPEFTALENVCIPALIARKSKKEAEALAQEYLSFLGLSSRLSHKPAELSGGEQQRVAVARALVNQPSIILADEPSGNLDSKNAEDLNTLFFELREKFNQTFIIVTHNDRLANMADRKLTIKDGRIIE